MDERLGFRQLIEQHVSSQRGSAEQWIEEGKQAVKMTRLSWGALRARFRSNEVRPWLSVMAYNLGKLWRRAPDWLAVESWL